jgi:hypothetical protein
MTYLAKSPRIDLRGIRDHFSSWQKKTQTEWGFKWELCISRTTLMIPRGLNKRDEVTL